ncbi:hypothetical protein V6N13_111507 [Hibiscus sabdariffa]
MAFPAYPPSVPKRTAQAFFNKLWHSSIPAKIKINAWRSESVNHLIRECTISSQVFAALNLDTTQEPDQEWFSWLARFTSGFYQHESSHSPSTPQHPPSSGNWSPSCEGTLKVNFDAAFDNINLVSSSGVVIRNHEGLLMAVGTFINSNILDPCIAEAKACEQAVELAADLNFHNVVVEGDSLIVIKKLQASIKDRSLICMLIQNIQRRFDDFMSLTYQHCQRNRNKVAHKIAHLGRSLSVSSIWIEEAPSVIEAAIEEDRWWNHPQA